MSHRDSEEEKLIEEIATAAIDYRWFPGQSRRISERDRGFALAVLGRIGKAYADGELELPGGVGLAMVIGLSRKPFLISYNPSEFEEAIRLGDIHIALRKEGQEEEK